VILFRIVDSRFPFLWESIGQPPSRWAGEVEAPVNVFADTPDGAWAELLRHEEITDIEDLAGLRTTLWVVEVDRSPAESTTLPAKVLTGDAGSYPQCRRWARRIHTRGSDGFTAPSAALLPGGARGYRVDSGLKAAPARDGRVIVLFGPRPDLRAWVACRDGRPDESLLSRVRYP